MEEAARQQQLAQFGVASGWRFALPHRVRWSECDPYGHANHRAYLEWFEHVRNRYLEEIGLGALHPERPGPVMAETTVRYRRPLAYGSEVLVTARTVRLGHTSLAMEYAVWCDGVAAECRAALILMINATGVKTPISDALRARITAYEAATGASPLAAAAAMS